MALHHQIRDRLTLPAICAPMMMISGPELVGAACKAGLIGGLPAHNARSIDELEAWLQAIKDDCADYRDQGHIGPIGPVALNISAIRPPEEIKAYLSLCKTFDISIVISAMGNPTELVKQAHGQGAIVFHDVTSIKHAEKAIAAGVDGLTCIASGGGGHSGVITPLTLIPKIRSMFDGTIIMAGAISNGAAIRAAEILGADLCYLGTRFIATKEARAPEAYKKMIVDGRAEDVIFTKDISGVEANWLKESLRSKGLDPDHLQPTSGPRNYDHLPVDVRPWRDLWSAGQGIELISDVPTVEDLVDQLRRDYRAACQVPNMYDGAKQPEIIPERAL